ncbi:hypothetical protein HK405_010572 [Cladochytrium tenue]|nr:hypothetical protein HK405_010572 [Cladochytrium tenue]
MKQPSRPHLSAIGSLAVAALAAVASPASVAALYCTEGVVSGSLCLTNCATGIGIDVEAPQLITGIDVGQFQVIFDPSDPWHPKVHSTTTVQLTLPDNFKQLDLSFFGAGANLTIWAQGLPVATLGVADYRNVTGSSASSSVVLPLTPEAGDHLSPSSVTGYAGFEAFFEGATLTSGDVPFSLIGWADTEAIVTQSGIDGSADLCLRYVPVNVTTSLTGLGGLTQVTTEEPLVVGGSASTGIELSVPLAITSPSDNVLLVSNTDAIFDLQYLGSKVGTVTLANLTINPGVNSYNGTGYIYPDTTDSAAVSATRKLLSAFTGGNTTDVTITNGRPSNMPPLAAAFGAVTLIQHLPPNTIPLIVNTSVNIYGLTYSYPCNITATNPFGAPATITHLEATIWYLGVNVSYVNVDTNFVIPAYGVATTKVYVYSNPVIAVKFIGSVNTTTHNTFGNITSSMTIDFGGYSTIIDYNQNTVLTHITSVKTIT